MRMIGIVLGALIGLAMPACSDDTASEPVIVHINQEGRQISETRQHYGSIRACNRSLREAYAAHWQAKAAGNRSGMKARCYPGES